MTDVRLDPDTHDLVFEDGQLVLVEGVEEVRQHIKQTLLAWRGEWVLNTSFGVPYRQQILVRNPNLGQISAALKVIVLGVPGVISLQRVELVHDDGQRTLTVDLEVLVADNTTDSEVDAASGEETGAEVLVMRVELAGSIFT